MKAKEWLKGVRVFLPNIVAITKDANGKVAYFVDDLPQLEGNEWDNCHEYPYYVDIPIEFDSEDFTKCIVTFNDL